MGEVVPVLRPQRYHELHDLTVALRPVTLEEFDTAFGPALQLHGRPLNWEYQRPVFHRLLVHKGIPADILAVAVMDALCSVKWFPKPPEVISVAMPAVEARRSERLRVAERLIPEAMDVWGQIARRERIKRLLMQADQGND